MDSRFGRLNGSLRHHTNWLRNSSPRLSRLQISLSKSRDAFFSQQNFGIGSARRGTQDGYIAKINGKKGARSPIMEQGFASRRSRVRSRKVFRTFRPLLSHTCPFARGRLATFFTLSPPCPYNSRNISLPSVLASYCAFSFLFSFLMSWTMCRNFRAILLRFKNKWCEVQGWIISTLTNHQDKRKKIIFHEKLGTSWNYRLKSLYMKLRFEKKFCANTMIFMQQLYWKKKIYIYHNKHWTQRHCKYRQVEREVTKNSGSVGSAVSLKYFTEQKISTN